MNDKKETANVITIPHGGKTVDLVNALRGYDWSDEHALLGALPTRLGALHAAYGAKLGALVPKGSTTARSALVLSGDESSPAWHIVHELPPAFPHYLMTRETFDAIVRAIPHNGMMTIDGRACALFAAYLDVERVGETWERTIVDRAHIALLLPYPWESSNVITIPHGGIVAPNEAKDARDTLCGLLDCIESNGVQNARITQADESAIRAAVKVLGAIVNGENVITIPHGGIVGEGSSS